MSEMGKISQWRFKLAVHRHHKVVYQMATGLLGDPSEAEDVTQDTFTQYWQKGADVEQAKAWLLRVARNNCLDRLRRSARVDYREHDELPMQTDNRDAPWRLQKDEASFRLHAEIAKLAEPQRSLIILFSLRGMNGQDCARILGISTNQVKVYLHRAKAKLREQLENIDE